MISRGLLTLDVGIGRGTRNELQRGTWKAPTAGRGTRKLLSDHIDEERGSTAALLTRDERQTWDEGPADAAGVELNMGRGTWKAPTLERGTRKLLSYHIGRGTREGRGMRDPPNYGQETKTHDLTDYRQATRNERPAVRDPTFLVALSHVSGARRSIPRSSSM
jgi:hypothetical protein